MEALVTVKTVRDRYGCSLPTARKYIRQCVPHMENPLATPEWAFREWEENRTVYPQEIRKKTIECIKQRTKAGKVVVPRKR